MKLSLGFIILLLLNMGFSSPSNYGVIFGLEDGELCVEGDQCSSYCCMDFNGFNRCAPLSIEGAVCENDGLWDVYDHCPCESGLSCVNSGSKKICSDPNDS
ncbi:colipase-like [Ciona intestinalis]